MELSWLHEGNITFVYSALCIRYLTYHSPLQLSAPSTTSLTVGKPIIELRYLVASSFPRQSSPLGPNQHLFPGRMIYPPSSSKPNLCRKVFVKGLKKTAAGQQLVRKCTIKKRARLASSQVLVGVKG